MGRGSGSIRPHLAVLLLLTGVLAGLLLRPHAAAPGRGGGAHRRRPSGGAVPPAPGLCGERGRPGGAGGLLLGRQVGRGGVGCALGRPGGGHRPGQQHQRGEPAFRAGLLRLRILVRRQRRRRPRRLCRRGQRRAGPAGPVHWADALPGDLAFYPDLSHVGIVAGRGEDGGLLVLHCSYSLGGVVCSSDAKAAGFTDLGRPSLFEKTP